LTNSYTGKNIFSIIMVKTIKVMKVNDKLKTGKIEFWILKFMYLLLIKVNLVYVYGLKSMYTLLGIHVKRYVQIDVRINIRF
jgi:hypothetical protein